MKSKANPPPTTNSTALIKNNNLNLGDNASKLLDQVKANSTTQSKSLINLEGKKLADPNE